MTAISIDERERAAFARALAELGYDPADFDVRITASHPSSRGLWVAHSRGHR